MKKRVETQHLVSLYTVQHLSSTEISLLTGLSRTAIKKRLNKAGISTNKGKGGPCWIKCSCDYCGKPIEITRKRWRLAIEHFCCDEHYYSSRQKEKYHPWRQGQRIARAVVSQFFQLSSDNVVHHKDNDNRNNDKTNLAVFSNQSEHLRFHHGKSKVNPIWDGST
jgi:hypothetical protein